jgi:predicted dehydrogenase
MVAGVNSSSGPIRVGIVGLSGRGGFASTAHLPALRALDGYEVVAVAASSLESARSAGEKYEVPLAFGSAKDLAEADEVDLVVISVKVPHHRDLVVSVLDASKPVFCEWPLGRSLDESRLLAREAADRDISSAVGLQARSSPTLRFLRDLIADGDVGEVLSSTIVGSGHSWGGTVPTAATRYTLDPENGASLLTIAVGHALDGVCFVLGELGGLRPRLATRRPRVLDLDSGDLLPMTVPDQVAVTGVFNNGAIGVLHYRGGMSRGTNLRWEINGTEGDIVVTGASGHLQLTDLTIHRARGRESALTPLEVPSRYHLAPHAATESARVCNVANAYARLRHDLREGTSHVPPFDEAVRRHATIDAIGQAGW